MLEPIEAFLLLVAFGVGMIVLILSRKVVGGSLDDFLVGSRKVGTWHGSLSIAVSWIWAPAVFICSLQAYKQGLAGIFWFTVPNILCFFLFAFLAIRVRRLLPKGYTLPDYIWFRFKGAKSTHLSFLAVYFGYQLGAIIINSLAGGTLLHLLSGMDFSLSVLLMSAIALSYSLISGLRASVMTDVVQMLMIIFIGFIIVPWVVVKGGGINVLASGLGGVSGEFRNIFHPGVLLAFGIPTTLGLLSGPVADQMFFQRAFAVRQKSIVKVFVIGGLIFGIVPITLSLLGFMGAAPEISSSLNVTDPQMIGPIVVAYFLPKWALMLFALMAFAGLCSTLDSALCALSSLGAVDVFQKYFKGKGDEKGSLKWARVTMILMAIVGTGIALLRPKLLWVFLIYGALASSVLFPTFLSVFWSRLTARGAKFATLIGLLIGTPLSIYANIKEEEILILVAALASVLVGLVVALIFGFLNKKPDEFQKFQKVKEPSIPISN